MGDRDSTPGWDFFISYTASDQKWAEWIAWQLESAGYQVLIQAWDFVPGSDWRLKMEHGIKRATRTIAILSKGYLISVYGGEEWRAARAADPEGLERKLLPIRIEECKRPGVLDTVVSVDLFDLPAPDASRRLLAAVSGAIQGRTKPTVEPDFPIRPGQQQRAYDTTTADLRPHPPASQQTVRTTYGAPIDYASNVEAIDSEIEPESAEKSRNIATGISPMRPTVWGNVPRRSKNFAGREELLTELRQRMIGGDQDTASIILHALHGMAGVGKTQLAIEYVYRNQNDYDLIWWISADSSVLIRSHLASLAPRLGLIDHGPLRTEDAVALVLDALRRGEPYTRWLLIFDNADSPELIEELIPYGPGSVIVTSRDRSWLSIADGIEVNIFSRQESVRFLQKRAPGIRPADVDRLAEALGDLPLALEQVGALHFETGIDTQTYLRLLEGSAGRLLMENPPSRYPPVAAAWTLSLSRLAKKSRLALDLLYRCAFLGPAPIALELFERGQYVLDSDFAMELQDPLKVGGAIREIGRFALARIDNHARTLQVHRLLQTVLREQMPAEDQQRIRGEVYRLLVAADPGEPESMANWPQFSQLLPHIAPSQVYRASEPPARRLIENITRYLHHAGDLTIGLAEADRALDCWISDSGPDDPDVLVLQGIKADILWMLGRYHDADQLRRPTLNAITRVLGEDHEETLLIVNGHGADLRARGEFEQARQLDEDSLRRHRLIFGDAHQASLLAANNLAVDLSLIGSYGRALETDKCNLSDRRALAVRDDVWTLQSMIAVARDYRQAGRYLEARTLAEQTYLSYLDLARCRDLAADHPHILLAAKDLSVARRKAGDFDGALNIAHEAYEKYTNAPQFGSEHPATLAAAVSLGNAQRVASDMDEATELLEKTFRGFRNVLGVDHPFAHGCALNLALVYRQLGRVEEAEKLLTDALAGLQARLGERHHYTLICVASLASVRAVFGHPDEALAMGERTLAEFRDLLGPDHPHTLSCASNVALDLATIGREDESAELSKETMGRYRGILGETHPDVQAELRAERLDFDFEPPHL
ncbi:FxSxx-COOH system tetratricopeptide repeat protein [Frankia tisae]|uniref:FxSxx-COOH system tetratricopeptide repeat protein n=2 Tax=Frankia tisae TaxID=2950104 RepID=UPI0021BF380D|nr:FxSxx-COOH system tetratricopeptide repeat protein [Frankia tisae]